MQHPVHLALLVLCVACGSSNTPQKPGQLFKKPFSVVVLNVALEYDVAVDGSVTVGSAHAGASRQATGKFERRDRFVSWSDPKDKHVVEAQRDVITFDGKVSSYHLGTNAAVTDASQHVVARLADGRLVSETQEAGCVVTDVDPQDARSAMLLILSMFAEPGTTTVLLC